MRENQLTKQEEAIVDGFSPETVERFMTPKNDFVFKRLFGTVGREKMVKDFLEAILNIKIKLVEIGKETILLADEIDEKTYGNNKKQKIEKNFIQTKRMIKNV